MSTIINDIFSELDRWDRWRLAVTNFKLDDTSCRIADPNITFKYDKFFKNKSLRSSNPKLSVIEEEQSINKSDCLVDYSVSNMDYSNLRHFTENLNIPIRISNIYVDI